MDFVIDRGYGWGIHITSCSAKVVLDGHVFSIYQGLNHKRWHAEYWTNAWRKTKTPIIDFDKEIQIG